MTSQLDGSAWEEISVPPLAMLYAWVRVHHLLPKGALWLAYHLLPGNKKRLKMKGNIKKRIHIIFFMLCMTLSNLLSDYNQNRKEGMSRYRITQNHIAHAKYKNLSVLETQLTLKVLIFSIKI